MICTGSYEKMGDICTFACQYMHIMDYLDYNKNSYIPPITIFYDSDGNEFDESDIRRYAIQPNNSKHKWYAAVCLLISETRTAYFSESFLLVMNNHNIFTGCIINIVDANSYNNYEFIALIPDKMGTIQNATCIWYEEGFDFILYEYDNVCYNICINSYLSDTIIKPISQIQ